MWISRLLEVITVEVDDIDHDEIRYSVGKTAAGAAREEEANERGTGAVKGKKK
jgi:hypothetical protein